MTPAEVLPYELFVEEQDGVRIEYYATLQDAVDRTGDFDLARQHLLKIVRGPEVLVEGTNPAIQIDPRAASRGS